VQYFVVVIFMYSYSILMHREMLHKIRSYTYTYVYSPTT